MAKRYPELEALPKYETNPKGKLIHPLPRREINGKEFILGDIYYEGKSARVIAKELKEIFGYKVIIVKRQPKAVFEVWCHLPDFSKAIEHLKERGK